MKKILATIVKESILMRRDVAGMLLLLIMPAILIVIMALIQDTPFKDYQELHFDLLLTDNDGGVLARQIINGLKQSKNFHVVDSLDNKSLSETELKSLLQKGVYQIGIVIPKGVTAEMVNASNIVVNNAGCYPACTGNAYRHVCADVLRPCYQTDFSHYHKYFTR